MFIRLYAKERGGGRGHYALSDQEVAIRSGLELPEIRKISRETSWDSVPIGNAERFCIGCNFDPFDYQDRNRLTSYSKRGTYAFLRASVHWETTYLPLIRIFKEFEESKGVGNAQVA